MGAAFASPVVFAQASDPALREIVEQNRLLVEQVKAQQRTIDALAAKVTDLQKTGDRHDEQLRSLRDGRAEADPGRGAAPERDRSHEVRVSGEVGVAFLHTGRAGSFPNSEFRLDDAKIAIEAAVVKDVYFYSEVLLSSREADADYIELGEVYADFENVSGRVGGPPRLLSLRAGRLFVPYGEEYQRRGPIANPLISHSLADTWGYCPGVEAYGSTGAWDYVVAVQNGGVNPLHDFNADKAVAARVAWAPAAWLRVSGNAMRTGELKVGADPVPGDFLSGQWFGNGFFRSIGGAKTTSTFWASLWEGNARASGRAGSLAAAVGGVRYGDNDRAANNARSMRYGSVEGVAGGHDGFFGATRFSWIDAPRGYPLVGWGNFGRYFFAPPLTETLQRLSVGFGYRWGDPLVLKLEYARERGHLVNGTARDQEDFFGAAAAVKF